MNIVDEIEQDYMKEDVPSFEVGDRVCVHVQIGEGGEDRIQKFEGDVIRKKNTGVNQTFTVRRLIQGDGIERTFPVHSPRVEKVEQVRKGKVRRAKLYYLRDRKGKSARVQERLDREEMEEEQEAEQNQASQETDEQEEAEEAEQEEAASDEEK